MPVVYKITYPNGKIYVGSDLTDCINYFGSASAALIAADFPDRHSRFTITKETLWVASKAATGKDVRFAERRLIEALESNNSAVGYNQSPKYRR